MSQINFGPIAEQHPEYRSLLRKLELWLAERASRRRASSAPTIDPRDLSRAWPEVDRLSLAILLRLLVETGAYRRVYKVITPSGAFADGDFDDPTKIPPKLPDRFNEYFETAEADVVPILEPAQR
jgi:hypothetical protein